MSDENYDPDLDPPPPITPYELEQTINTLPTKKAKGPDDIANELVKLALPAANTHLLTVFNACLTLSYFPSEWKEATTVILRKYDKPDYSEAGAYRPIALLSCLGKVFETILSKRLTYWAERMGAIAPGHMGGRRLRSTEDAGISLVTWIKLKWRQGLIVTGLFLDVKSAFPSVHTTRLWYTLKKKGCPVYLRKIILAFLTNRSTKLRMQDFLSDSFDIENGLPQRSPLSPILYVLYNSSLLLPTPISPHTNSISLGFIDDVSHLVANRDIKNNVDQIQELGRRSLDWGSTHGALFDERKAQMMHFTNRKHSNPTITFGHQVLIPQSELRWLGYWLHPKLSFNAHINKVKDTGRKTIAQLRRINKAYSGLGPREAKHLVTSVLRSRVLYGSVVWFTAANFGKVMKMFNSLHAEANRMILGAFKTSPTELMAHDTNLTPFAIAAVRLHHLFLHKRMTAPDNHPTKVLIKHELGRNRRAHRSPISDMIRVEDFEGLHTHQCETIQPFPSPPWEQPTGELINFELDREEATIKVGGQVEDEEARGAMVIFTDGSLSEEGGGAAAVSKFETRTLSCSPDGITNNELGLLAIGLAIAQFQANNHTDNGRIKYQALAIFSDSQVALKQLHEPLKPQPMQYLAKSTKLFLRKINDIPVRLYWTPGHAGIELNEKADEKAKQAAEKRTTQRLTPYSLSTLLQKTQETFHLKTAGFTTGKKKLRVQPRKVADALSQLEKGEAATIFHLCSGHSPLNEYLKRFKHHDTGKCNHCRIPETVAHFLLHCPQFKQQRKAFRHEIKEENIKVNPFSLPSLLNTTQVYPLLAKFALTTGRFRFLKTHTQQNDKPESGSKQNMM